ncbi:DUF4136 domain-containing protein [Marilutibacter chinensis]|uniref:DUF4136 domain-containing protein n=1 Tax=Marilutibacter chinensis TaxID=2912247 RepID=A0ABS9HPY9_9GAMM|nr:DUF4136 domain-containing protein [Lysobacter chinensis]MCF7220678.1 DUF4136 domain-containing protein [Lysobacter chinensis]
MRHPHRFVRFVLACVAIALLASCASGPRVRTELDPEADFSRYRSYAFYQPLAMEESGYSTYLTDRIKASVRREMDARGYVFDETSPDLRVNFQAVVQEKTDVYTVPRTDVTYFYSYRHRHYVAVPYWYDQTEVSRYTEGTLTIDVVDAARNRLVWTGDAIGRVVQRTPQERAAAADQAVAAIFMQFPFAAGSSPPAP